MAADLDETDIRILEILKKDSRTPFTEIGATLGISDSTVHLRLRRMREEGVLRGFTVDIDEEALGKKVHGFAMINVDPGHLENVINRLKEKDWLDQIYETHGSNDLITIIAAQSLEALRDAIMDIRRIDHVRSTELVPILKTWKIA